MTPLRAAMALLAKREYARRELAEKLARRFDSDAVRAALDDLSARGWLSDLRFARAYLRQTAAKFGQEKLRENLRLRGVGEDDIAAALSDLPPDDRARAAEALSAKYGNAILADDKARARGERFLRGRGFSEEDAAQAMAMHQRRAKESRRNRPPLP